MTIYKKDGVTYTEAQIRALHPNTSFPKPMKPEHVASFGYVAVTEDPVVVQPSTPSAPGVVIPATAVSKLNFFGRFTLEETAKIYSAAKKSVMVEIMLDKMKMAEFIDLADPDTIQAVHYLAANKLIGIERVNQILTK